MTSPRRSVLPESLTAKFAVLQTRLGDGELADALAELDTLPANSIVRASREIATAARLGWWQPQMSFSLRQLFDKTTEQGLLRQNPDYAWLFLFHPSGYMREAALDTLNNPPASPFFFSALAWRLNDWVPSVRRAAERCAERVLHRTGAEVIATAALYLLDRRLVWGRWINEPKVLDAAFQRSDVIAALAAQLQQHPTGPLATCLRNALRFPNIDEHLPSLAAAAIQPPVRAIAYQCLISGNATWPVGFEWIWIDKVYGLRRQIPELETREIKRTRPATDLIREAVYDKSAFVRRVAADALIAARSQLPDEDRLISHLAKDRSSAIRSRADYMLRHPPSERTT
jgi:hypothetical protein